MMHGHKNAKLNIVLFFNKKIYITHFNLQIEMSLY